MDEELLEAINDDSYILEISPKEQREIDFNIEFKGLI